MINFIRKIFFKKVDPLFSKIRDCLLLYRPELVKSTSIFYFIDGFIYSKERNNQIENRILNGESIAELITGFPKDLKLDNIELYLIQNDENWHLISLYDPYDLFINSKILNIWPVASNFISTFKKVERLN